jgi:hypothetical protein
MRILENQLALDKIQWKNMRDLEHVFAYDTNGGEHM